jgi:hypothetical protein
MEDPVVGGLTTDRIALRRAISMAYNVDEDIRIARQGQAEPSTQPLPPNVEGHDPNFQGYVRYDVRGAKALLDKFGYIDGDGDGGRDLPDGKPLVLSLASPPSSSDRLYDELWQKSLAAVGLRVEFVKQKWPDLLKMGRAGKLQMWTLANTSSTPDGVGFFDLLYGPNAKSKTQGENVSNYENPEYDKLYRELQALDDGAGAPENVSPLVGARHGLRAVATERLSARNHPRAAVAAGLQIQHVLRASLAVLRHRYEAQGRRLTAATFSVQRSVAQIRHSRQRSHARSTIAIARLTRSRVHWCRLATLQGSSLLTQNMPRPSSPRLPRSRRASQEDTLPPAHFPASARGRRCRDLSPGIPAGLGGNRDPGFSRVSFLAGGD